MTPYGTLRSALESHLARDNTEELMAWLTDGDAIRQVEAWLVTVGADAPARKVLAVFFLKIEANAIFQAREEDEVMRSEAERFWGAFMCGDASADEVCRATRFQDAWAALDCYMTVSHSSIPSSARNTS